MSAIAGILHFNKEPINNIDAINLMKSLEKFPADDVQVWQKENIFLGCHKQCITPESVNEILPFYDYERECVITADAIIDNREELYEKLQVKAIERKQMTDSKLILLSYYKWGEDAPKFLVGDFSFIIWDERKNKLFGSRDFSGMRTLYFHQDSNRFTFSTTIEPLITLPYIEKRMNEQWLADYLAIPDMLDSIDSSSTIYKNINQVPPSHIICVTETKVSIKKFNPINFGKKLKLKSNEEYEEAFRDVFQKAVNEKIRTHKNVGAQLSGGLDSSSVVSFAVKYLQLKNKRINTFSYIPPKDFVDFTPRNRLADERPYIKSIVQHVGNIDDFYLDFDGKSSLTEVDDMLEIMETPYKFAENSFWLKGSYEKAHEKGIGVLLNGAGGNFTISWGLATEYYALLLKRFKWIRLYHELNLYSKNMGTTKSKMVKTIGKTAFPYTTSKGLNNSQTPILINQDFANRTSVFENLKSQNYDIDGANSPNVYQVRRNWFRNGLYWNTYGTVATKLSLRYSLWNRDPTNDLRVIKFCLSVPEDQFVQNGYNRSLIRRSTKDYLPDNVRLNQKVRGIQAADWVHRIIPSWQIFMSELQQISVDPLISEFFDMGVVKKLITKFEKEPRSDYAFNPEFRVLMRCIIVSRFLKKNFLERRW